MRIVFIGLDIYSETGGIARYTRRLLRAMDELLEHAIQSCTVISLWDGAEDREKAPQGIDFVPCSHRKYFALFAFVRQILLKKPDVIFYGHILFSPLVILGRLLCPGARQFLVVYGIEVWGGNHRSAPQWEGWLIQHFFDRIITISRYTRRRMMETFGVQENRFDILTPAVDVDHVELRPDISKKNKILSVCRLTLEDRYKGIDRVIRVMPLILDKFPDVAYTIIGEGPLRAELQRMAEEIGIGESVQFLGYVDDVDLQDAYDQSNIFVLPSSGEGFGIVFIEAFLNSVPVICGNADASAEVVTNGYSGITIDPLSSNELAEAIIRLLSNPGLARELGRNGCRTVFERYTHEVFRNTLSEILKR